MLDISIPVFIDNNEDNDELNNKDLEKLIK